MSLFTGDRLSAPKDILLDYDGGEISPWRCTSRGSLAAFIDSEYRLFVKNLLVSEYQGTVKAFESADFFAIE